MSVLGASWDRLVLSWSLGSGAYGFAGFIIIRVRPGPMARDVYLRDASLAHRALVLIQLIGMAADWSRSTSSTRPSTNATPTASKVKGLLDRALPVSLVEQAAR